MTGFAKNFINKQKNELKRSQVNTQSLSHWEEQECENKSDTASLHSY